MYSNLHVCLISLTVQPYLSTEHIKAGVHLQKWLQFPMKGLPYELIFKDNPAHELSCSIHKAAMKGKRIQVSKSTSNTEYIKQC